jgi:hypothetical protein
MGKSVLLHMTIRWVAFVFPAIAVLLRIAGLLCSGWIDMHRPSERGDCAIDRRPLPHWTDMFRQTLHPIELLLVYALEATTSSSAAGVQQSQCL